MTDFFSSLRAKNCKIKYFAFNIKNFKYFTFKFDL